MIMMAMQRTSVAVSVGLLDSIGWRDVRKVILAKEEIVN